MTENRQWPWAEEPGPRFPEMGAVLGGPAPILLPLGASFLGRGW